MMSNKNFSCFKMYLIFGLVISLLLTSCTQNAIAPPVIYHENDPFVIPEDKIQDKPVSSVIKGNVVSVDGAGRLIVNSEPFFVIGLYSVPKDKLGHAKELGFNAVHTYAAEGAKDVFRMQRPRAMLNYLNVAEQENLMVWMGLSRYELTHDFTPVISRFIDGLKYSPALLAWSLYDEPDCQKVPASKIEFVARMLRRQDPNHPKLLVLCKADKRSQTYFSIPDIMLTDLYPLNAKGADIGGVTQRLDVVNRGLKNNIPLWNVVQLHGKGKGGSGFGLLEPNFDELRNMVYQSIVAGAKGLLFFAYNSSQFKLFDSPQGLINIKKMTAELTALSPVFLASSVTSNFISIKKNVSIRKRIFKLENKYYLFLVNLSRGGENIEVKFNSPPSYVREISSSKNIKLKNGRIISTINSIGVRIYEIYYE